MSAWVFREGPKWLFLSPRPSPNHSLLLKLIQVGTYCQGSLDVETIDDNALAPVPLKGSGHLHRTLLVNHGADEVQGGINASADTTRCYNTETAKSHRCTANDRLAACVGALEGHASLSGIRRSSSSVGLATDVGVIILLTKIESEVVDNVSGVFYDVGTFLEVLCSGITAHVLKCSKVVGVGGRRETRENTLLGKEEGTGADGQNGSLTGGVTLLELREVGDEAQRLKLLLDNFLRVASHDDKDIKVLEAFVGLLIRDLGSNEDTLIGENLGLRTDDGDLKSLGALRVLEIVGGRVEHLERAGEVKKVKLLVNRKEHVNGLLVSDGRGLACTHLAGIVMGVWVVGWW